MDIIDDAQALNELYQEVSIAAARAKAATPPPADWDGESCHECGGEIAPARLQLGRWTCVECQGRLEFLRRMHA